MADPAVVSTKLEQIEQYYGELRSMQALSREEFLNDVWKQRAVERMFENAIQACTDLSQHVATADFGYDGETGRGAVDVLVDHGVVDDATGAKLSDAVGFRNVLAHEYGHVDPERVYDYLQHDLQVYDEFGRQVAAWFTAEEA